MSYASQFLGGDRIASSLVNSAYQLASVASAVINAVSTLSGAMPTANVLKTALSITGGRGQINWLAVARANIIASKTIRTKVTIDGTVVYDKTDVASGASGTGYVVIGAVTGSGTGSFQPLRWRTSLLIEIADSVSETDGITVFWNYEVHQ